MHAATRRQQHVRIAGIGDVPRVHPVRSRGMILFLFLGWALYNLFKDVDRRLAMLMVILVSVSATIGIVGTANLFAPLVLSSDAGFLSSFTKPQLDALAFTFLELRGSGITLNLAFWGLWLFPLGLLVLESRFFPVHRHLADRRRLRLSRRSASRRSPFRRTNPSCPLVTTPMGFGELVMMVCCSRDPTFRLLPAREH